MNGKCPICNLDSAVEDKGLHADIYHADGAALGARIQVRVRCQDEDFQSRSRFSPAQGCGSRRHGIRGGILAPYLSIYVREITSTSTGRLALSSGTAKKLEEMAETYADTPISAKPHRLLRLLAPRTRHPGARANVKSELDYPQFT